MKTIEKLDFFRLWNSEHPRVYNRLIGIAEKHNPVTLHLDGPLQRAKAHLPELEKIEAVERGSILSIRLADLDSRRDNLISAVSGLVKSLAVADMPAARNHVAIAAQWLAKHDVSSIASANYTSETERVADMLAEARRTPLLADALRELNMNPFIDELADVNTQFETLFMQRTDEGANVVQTDSKAIRAAADKDMRRLFHFIELYQVEYPDIDYLPLVNELNELLAYYKAQLAARNARRKKGIDIGQEQPIG